MSGGSELSDKTGARAGSVFRRQLTTKGPRLTLSAGLLLATWCHIAPDVLPISVAQTNRQTLSPEEFRTRENLATLRIHSRSRIPELVNSEFAFLDRICKLSNDQKQKLRVEREAIIQAITQTIMDTQHTYDYRNTLEDAVQGRVMVLAERHLTSEQGSRYKAEVANRLESRRLGLILVLVAYFDERLGLSDQQRKNITAKLLADFDVRKYFSLAGVMQNENSDSPFEIVEPFLTDDQKANWQVLTKTKITQRSGVPFRTVPFKGDPLATEYGP